MNMKKSIAGVMAGAMAVSAIATTASAWTGGDADQAQIVLSYDLNKEYEAYSNGTVTVKYTYNDLAGGGYYKLTGIDGKGLKTGGVTQVQLGAKLKGDDIGWYELASATFNGTSARVGSDQSANPVVSNAVKFVKDANINGMDGKNDAKFIGYDHTVVDGNGNIYAYKVYFSANKQNSYVENYWNTSATFAMDGFKVADGVDTSTTAWVDIAGGVKTRYNTNAAATAALDTDFTAVEADPANTYVYTWTTTTAGTPATNATANSAATPDGYTAIVGAFDNKDDANRTAAAYVARMKDKTKAAAGDVIDVVIIDSTSTAVYHADASATLNAANWAAATNKPLTAGQYAVYVSLATTTAVAPVTETKTERDETLANAMRDMDASNGYASVSAVTTTDGAGNIYYITDGNGHYKGTHKKDTTTNEGEDIYAFSRYDVTLVYNTNVNAWTNWSNNWAFTAANIEAAGAGIENINANIPEINFTEGAHGNYYKPMRTNWNAPAEVVSRLTDLGYTYPQAVLNDVIANNENVAFTFTTAQKYVDNREYVKVSSVVRDLGGSKYDVIVENPLGGKTTATNVEGLVKGGDTYVKNPYYGVAYDANKDNDFTGIKKALWYNPVFTQDLYQKFTWNDNNGYTASGPNGSQGSKDQFGSYASIWNTNLTSAGLVANSRWTMQLSDVDAFEWGDSTITFFWDAITDEANVTNAANFLQTLQLYTPSEWFWDKLDVAVGAAIAEEVSADAPLEETAEEVEDEEPEVELIEETEDEDEGDEYFDEDEGDDFFEDDGDDFFDDNTEDEGSDETETQPEETAPETIEVESPKTGNAPVALAVIPVALAAAAVVAKKRK